MLGGYPQSGQGVGEEWTVEAAGAGADERRPFAGDGRFEAVIPAIWGECPQLGCPVVVGMAEDVRDAWARCGDTLGKLQARMSGGRLPEMAALRRGFRPSGANGRS